MFPCLCLLGLGAGSTGCLIAVFHFTHFPFKYSCSRENEGLSKATSVLREQLGFHALDQEAQGMKLFRKNKWK